MLRKIMLILISGVGLASGHATDASAHSGCGYASGRGFYLTAPTCGNTWSWDRHVVRRHYSSGYWSDHDCTVPYSYNAFGSWNGFACTPRR